LVPQLPLKAGVLVNKNSIAPVNGAIL